MKLQITQRIESPAVNAFVTQYERPEVPVILTDFSKAWKARDKWSLQFLKEQFGNLPLEVHDGDFYKPGKGYMKASHKMSLSNYIQKLQAGPTHLRMFLFDVYKHTRQLMDDIEYNPLMRRPLRKFPFLFCGAKGGHTQLHYDIDMCHVFHTVFEGEKTFYLFPNEQEKNLYRHPLTVKSDVNVIDPDYERFPRLKNAKGYKADLKAGDTLFIPAGYFHHIIYHSASLSVSQRSFHERRLKRWHGLFNFIVVQGLDRLINKLAPVKWFEFKTTLAQN